MVARPDVLYAPLRAATSIRLLTLHPGTGPGPLHASLKEVHIADDIRFEALSYTWGSTEKQKNIIINGHRVLTRNNLWTFLQLLRDADEPRVLWADFLCIHQGDPDEQAQQVGIMDQIYSYATRVLAWVGPHADGSEALFRPWPALEPVERPFQGVPPAKMSGFGGRLRRVAGHGEEYYKRQHAIGVDKELRQLRLAQLDDRKCVWEAFAKRAYFARMWIVQEISVADKVVIHCGDSRMDWHELVTSRRPRETEFDGMPVPAYEHEPIQRLIELDDSRDSFRAEPGERPHLFELIRTFGGKGCQDPRDHIFALTSLERRHKDNTDIRPDYRISTPRLLVQVVGQRRQDHCTGADVLSEQYWDKGVDVMEDLYAALGLTPEQQREVLDLLKAEAERPAGME